MNYLYQPIHRWVDDLYILVMLAGISFGWQVIRILSVPGQSRCRQSGVNGMFHPRVRELDAPPRPCNWAAAGKGKRRGWTEYCDTTGEII